MARPTTNGGTFPMDERGAANLRPDSCRETERTPHDDSPQAIRTGLARNVGELRASGLDLSLLETEGPFESRLEWFDLLQRSVFPADSGIRYVHASDGGRIVALLPVRADRRNGVRKIQALGNFYTPLFAPPISCGQGNGVPKQLLKRATEIAGRADVLLFSPMDPDSPLFRDLLVQIEALGWIPFKFFCFGNWYLPVTGDWQHYLASRGANLRGNIQRRTRRFLDAGGALELVTDASALDEAIAAFESVYSASWKRAEPYPRFIPALIYQLASDEALRLGIARLNGRPVAAQLWFVAGGKASIYKVAYDEACARYSPGTVLTAHLMRQAIDGDRVGEVDFLIGDDAYKKKWMTHRRERWGIVAYDPRTLMGGALLLREVFSRSAKPLRDRLRRILENRHGAESQVIDDAHWRKDE
jgi:CelD/BcsL family acetyltransferase involved in cellulose biosynthesis